MKKTLLTLSLLACALTAQAADPVALSLTSGLSFAEYTGGTPVGRGNVNDNTHLYFIDERDSATESAWTVFFDPTLSTRVQAMLQFDRPIVAVQTTSAAFDLGTVRYGVDVDHDGRFNDYGVRASTGLEANDALTWAQGSNTLFIDWRVNRLGDHIRVITAVPEPSTYAMLLLGFGLIGFAGLRRARHTRRD